MTIIYKGRLITVTMEVPGLSSLDYKRKYQAHLESLWQSSTIHASKELMERFKDGETIVEGKDYVHSDAVFDKTTGRFICIANNSHNLKINYSQVEFRRIALPVPLPTVEEGSQDEAVKFADWLVKRKVEPIGGGIWEDHGDAGEFACPVRRTKELYQIFKSTPCTTNKHQ